MCQALSPEEARVTRSPAPVSLSRGTMCGSTVPSPVLDALRPQERCITPAPGLERSLPEPPEAGPGAKGKLPGEEAAGPAVRSGRERCLHS